MTKNEKLLVQTCHSLIGALAVTASELAKMKGKPLMTDGLQPLARKAMERSFKVIEKMESQ